MDDLLRWAGVIGTALGAAFGYGHLHSKVLTMDEVNRSNAHKLDQILSEVGAVRERLARLEGRDHN